MDHGKGFADKEHIASCSGEIPEVTREDRAIAGRELQESLAGAEEDPVTKLKSSSLGSVPAAGFRAPQGLSSIVFADTDGAHPGTR